MSDLGAVFYNPGRLAQLPRAGFLLTAQAFEVSQVEMEFGEGESGEIEQSKLRKIPSLVAGKFSLSFLPGHDFAYSFLTRRRSKLNLLQTRQETLDLVPDFPGAETAVGVWESESDLEEDWMGITWAHGFTPRFSVGISTFGTYLSRRNRIDYDVRVVPTAGDQSAVIRFREHRIKSFGLLWKAGMALDLTPFHLGLSLTTPQISARGSGKMRYEDLLTVADPGGPDPVEEEAVVFSETGLDVEVRTPMALGAGVSWVGDRAAVHFSGEWYSGISPYTIMGADSIPSLSTGKTYRYEVVDESRSIFNAGVGVELQVATGFSAFGSLATDASAAPNDPFRPFAFEDQVSISTSKADGFHLGAGVSLETRGVDLTAGFTFGAIEERQPNPFSGSGGRYTQMIPASEDVTFKNRRWRFLLGFSVPWVQEIS